MSKVIEKTTASRYVDRDYMSCIDFSDTFATTNHENNLQEIAHLIFDNPPGWVRWLFTLRNNFVKLFGLKTELPADYNERFAIGGYVGFFKIFSISDGEIFLGADDKHLNFRAIISYSNDVSHNIEVITLVQYNNLAGKMYMRVIKPFHRIVVKRMVSNAYKNHLKGDQ